jgi:hypothetical protein
MRFLRLMVFLGAMVCGASMHAHAEDTHDSCGAALHDPRWKISDNTTLIQARDTILKKSKAAISILLCEGPDPHKMVAFSFAPVPDMPSFVVIAFNSVFLSKHASTLSAIMAHEIAHYTAPSGMTCTILLHMDLFQDYRECESQVDKEASRWVGKAKMRKALRTLLTYFSKTLSHEHFLVAEQDIEYRIQKLQ